jgi:hypothetical protein
MEFNEMHQVYGRRRSAPDEPGHFTGTLIPPGHHLFDFYRRRHHHHYGVFPMQTVVFSWVNTTTRKDGSSLSAADIGSSIISQVNADGTTTVVDTVAGNGTSATIAAPTAPGTYNYQVVNIDTNGVVGDPLAAKAPVVIQVPVDSSPPNAPTEFTATLSADVPAAA